MDFSRLLVFLNASVEGPPCLVLGDVPHLTCRDTQSSEELSAYFPRTPNSASHCMRTTSDLVRATRPATEKPGGMSSRRLRTCLSMVEKDATRSCLHSHQDFHTFTFLAGASQPKVEHLHLQCTTVSSSQTSGKRGNLSPLKPRHLHTFLLSYHHCLYHLHTFLLIPPLFVSAV